MFPPSRRPAPAVGPEPPEEVGPQATADRPLLLAVGPERPRVSPTAPVRLRHASGVQAALRAAAEEAPSAVVTVARLPDGAGTDVAAAFATHHADAPTVVIVPRPCDLVPTVARLWGGALAEPDSFVRRVRAAAMARLADPTFGAGGLARAVGLSPRQLRRRLAAAGEAPARALIRRARIEAAAVLLASGQRSVKQAQHDVGFKSASGFRRAFRHELGTSPSDYAEVSRPRAPLSHPASGPP